MGSEDETEAMSLKRTIRYCIQCGRDISEALFCNSPDCAGIPNFYRDVPAPAPRKRKPVRRVVTVEPSTASPTPRPQGGRRTVPMPTAGRPDPVAVLLGVDSPRRIFIFPGKVDVGARAPAREIIDVPEVSSMHAVIECSKGSGGAWEVTVSDCSSTNGTFVNGKSIERHHLRSSDVVRFAAVEFEFRFLPASESRRTVTA